jgi:hypothetical protein
MFSTLPSSQHFFYFFFFQHFYFFLLFPSVFTPLCFFLPWYFTQFLDHVLRIHVTMNYKTSKKHTTSYIKQKQLVMVTLLIFILQLPTNLIHFWANCHLLLNASSLKLWWSTTITFCVHVQPHGSMSLHHDEWTPQILSFYYYASITFLG